MLFSQGDALALKCDAVVVSCDGTGPILCPEVCSLLIPGHVLCVQRKQRYLAGSISTTGGFGRGLAAGLFKNGVSDAVVFLARVALPS